MISVVYHPPQGNAAPFFEFLDHSSEYASRYRYDLILGGDFNVNLLAPSTITTEFLNLLEANNLSNVIHCPTHITASYSSLLYLFLTNIELDHVSAGTINCAVSDHLPIYFILKKASVNRKRRHTMPYQIITQVTLTRFRNLVANKVWEDVYAESAYNIFFAKFEAIYNECFPVKMFKQGRKAQKPWVSKECIKMIQEKNALFATFMKSRDIGDQPFRKCRNKLNKAIRHSKKRYLSDLFSPTTLSSPDKTWKHINSLLGRSVPHGIQIIQNGDVVPDATLANMFNEHFINLTQQSNSKTPNNYVSEHSMKSFHLHPATEAEVFVTYQTLRNTNSTDVDDIQL